jgi:presenilin-like A22 family membrane protease
MKHPKRIVVILLIMFFLTQLVGLLVISFYPPVTSEVITESGEVINKTTNNLPFGTDPPQGIEPKDALWQIIIAIAIAVGLMLFFIKFRAELILRAWFFIVVTLAIGITVNAPFLKFNLFQNILNPVVWPFPTAWLIALFIGLPFAYLKIFNRNIIIHNISELLIYPGIAAIFVPLLSIWTVVLLLILISIYDIYAVWHAGFMQKMAKFQIEKLKFFTGFFVPYMSKENKEKINKAKRRKKQKEVKVSVPIAILGGGDVVFPIILAGVVFQSLGLFSALLISVFATVALGLLFYASEKGKFYPAMPFISAGCFVGLGLAYLIPLFF